VGANDPVTVAAAVVVLAAMSLVACYLPAHRAIRTDPVAAIREQ
jgi:ABC-type lipoprotein release transport system permease subunit